MNANHIRDYNKKTKFRGDDNMRNFSTYTYIKWNSMLYCGLIFSMVFVASSFLVSFDANGFGSVARAIAREVVEYISRKGGSEILESISKKVGKEAFEELAERTVKEVGEEGAKKMMNELGEQIIKHGDDVFIAANKYGSKNILNILKEVPEETCKKALRAVLNRGDELVPAVQKFGKEIIEVEVKHPGLSTRIAEKLGKEGLTVSKNLSTEQMVKILKRDDILQTLTNEGKESLVKAINSSQKNSIIDVFENHPNVTNAITRLLSLGIITTGAVIGIDKLSHSEVNGDRISLFHDVNTTQNPDGNIAKSINTKPGGFFSEAGKGAKWMFIIIGCSFAGIILLKGVSYLRKSAKNMK